MVKVLVLLHLCVKLKVLAGLGPDWLQDVQPTKFLWQDVGIVQFLTVVHERSRLLDPEA